MTAEGTSEGNHHVKIYSTDTWPYCHQAKDWLTSKNITFEDVDVAKDREALQEMVKNSGQMGVPVIDVDGEITVGFDRERLAQLLGI